MLLCKYADLNSLNDPNWWIGVSKWSLNEVIVEIKKMNIDLNIDIEWEVLLLKQHHNYLNICESFIIESLPIETHLFKAIDGCSLPWYFDHQHQDYKEIMDNYKKLHSLPKLGWENLSISTDIHVIPVDGDHLTMITDPKNRCLFGKKLTKCLLVGDEITITKKKYCNYL